MKLVDINQFRGLYDEALLNLVGYFPEYMLLGIILLALRNEIALHMQELVLKNISRVLK